MCVTHDLYRLIFGHLYRSMLLALKQSSICCLIPTCLASIISYP